KDAHEPNLRRRLKETLAFIGPAVRPLSGRPSRFIDRVIRMRNALTHWEEGKASQAGQDLYGTAAVLTYLIDAALLRSIGLSEDEVTATFENNEHFKWAASAFAQD
ncbi:MAG: ApeA N-terminal domain 1, partial [Acidimicrobiaceae bacterium]